ncbi:MAG: AzlD domain-containing protein [Clostridiales bacterium]|nr:AzlD domain-containing protein [Clostridiales bacterium]
MAASRLLSYISVMALVTYLIRMLPITLIRGRIENPLFRSFLYYIPYAVLAAMIVPDMLFATRSIWSGGAALAAGLLMALRGHKLPAVAAAACAAVFAAELLLGIGS